MYCFHSPCNQGTSLFYSSVSFCTPSSTLPHLSEWWATPQQPSSIIIAEIMWYPTVLLELCASISCHACDLRLLLCTAPAPGRKVPFCLQRSMEAGREAGIGTSGTYVLGMQGLCVFKCFSCGQTWKVFTRKVEGTSLLEWVTHLAKFLVPLPHVVRSLAFLQAPSNHYPRRRSWMSLAILACISYHFIPTWVKKLYLSSETGKGKMVWLKFLTMNLKGGCDLQDGNIHLQC